MHSMIYLLSAVRNIFFPLKFFKLFYEKVNIESEYLYMSLRQKFQP